METHEAAPPRSADLLKQIRHDLKTPFNQIIGYGEMLLEDAEAAGPGEAVDLLAEIVESAKDCVLKQEAVLQAGAETVDDAVWGALCPEIVRRSRKVADLVGRLRPMEAMADSGPDLDRLVRAAGNLEILALDAPRRWAEGTDAVVVEEAPVVDAAGPGPQPVHAVPAQKPVFAVEDDAAEAARESSGPPGRILVVDDNEANRDMLSRRLMRQGHSVALAGGGREALAKMTAESFDLLLLDILMPDLDGFEVLRAVRANPAWRATAVIMISALDEIGSVVRCIEMGAEDYLPKPFDPVLLRARIGAILDRKRLRDAELERTAQIEEAFREAERQKCAAEAMLRNILPDKVASELREFGAVEPMYFEDVTIGFTDFVGFTTLTERLAAEELVGLLHEYFTAFDRIVERYGLEKMKTIGDSYMFCGGMPDRRPSHPVDAVLAALEMADAVKKISRPDGVAEWKVRIGLHTGPVIAGVVGIHKFAFDIWGEAVNYASRMESSGAADRVNMSERMYSRVKDFIQCTPRGPVRTKDGRDVEMYFAEGPLGKLMDGKGGATPPAFARRYKIYFQKEPRSFPEFLLGA